MENIFVVWSVISFAIGFFTIALIMANGNNSKIKSKRLGSIIMLISGALGLGLSVNYLDNTSDDVTGTIIFGIVGIIGFIIYLLSNKIYNGKINSIKKEVEEQLLEDTITIDSGEDIITIKRSDLINVGKGLSQKITWVYKENNSIRSVTETIKPEEKCMAYWLAYYHEIPYHQIDKYNLIKITSLLLDNAEELKQKFSPSKREEFEKEIKRFKERYNDFAHTVLTSNTYMPKKPFNPFVSAGIANGIAGPIAGYAAYQESKIANEKYNKSIEKLDKSIKDFDYAKNNFFDDVNRMEEMIFKEPKASKYWEKKKSSLYKTYDKYLDSLLIK